MANEVYTEEIQFKLHDKFEIFLQESDDIRSDISLLAAASTRGLLFAGNPNAPELKVFLTKQLVNAKSSGQSLLVRTIPLLGVPHTLACNADGSMLAVNYTVNDNAFLNIYAVETFLTSNVSLLYNMRLPHDTNITARQLLWNPVLTSSIAVIMSNGSVAMFTLMEQGKFEMHTLDKSQQVKCGCWSPKGKQIVFGFPNGKLQQFKPDLTPAKTIACPAGTVSGPFDVIALHWLSTFQFAAIFLQHGDDMLPNLYIINAPKGGTPTYHCYNDICYSSSGMRAQQFTFNHIPQWNLLLVSSANGIEVGILGTKDAGDTPTWFPYSLAGEARIEMPLVKNTTETYPIGFAIDTGSTHQLTVGEQRCPVMPMVFVLSTHGHLIAYDFLNLIPGAVDICSPPPPVQDASGEFQPLASLQPSNSQQSSQAPPATPASADLSFGFGSSTTAVTSTPAPQKDKPAPMFGGFGAPAQQPSFAQPSSAGFGFGGGGNKPASSTAFALPTTGITAKPPLFGSATSTAAPATSGFGGGFTGFGSSTGGSTFSGFGGLGAAKPVEPAKPTSSETTPAHPAQQPSLTQKPQQQATPQPPPPAEVNKPLYTVSNKFNPPTPIATSTGQPSSASPQQQAEMSSSKIDEIYREMIAVTINSFSAEIKQVAKKSNGLLDDLGDPSQLKACTKRLNLLQEINEQAKDSEFESDVQNLRHSLNEAYAMVAEVRSKLEIYKNPDITRLAVITPHDPLNQRQLAKLNSLVLTNQSQLQLLQQQIDGNWSDYQDTLRRRSKHHMHIPCLDGLYERMSNLKDMLAEQRKRLELVKKQLHDKGMYFKSQRDSTTPSIVKARQDHSIDNLADSMLSLSVANVSFRPRLPLEKLDALRALTKQQKDIKIIKPQRPNRVGLKSEVILETKLKCDKQAAALTQKHAKENQAQKAAAAKQQQQQQSAQKPAATQANKPKAVIPSQPQQQSTQSFNFASSNFQAAPAAAETVTPAAKPLAAAVAATPTPAPFSFAQPSNTSSFAAFTSQDKGGFSFAQPKPSIDSTKPPAVSQPQPQAPVSFSAKVITSEAADSSSGFMMKPSVAKPSTATPNTTSLSTTKASTTKPVEETTTSFSFGGLSSATPTLPTFSGFGSIATSKSSAATLFDGKSSSASAATTSVTTTTTSTTATVAAPTSTFSFGGLASSFGATSTASPFGGISSSSTAPTTFSFAQPQSTAGGDKTQKPLSTAFAGFGQKVDGGVASSALSSSAKPAAVSAVATTTTPAATNVVSSTTAPTTAADSPLSNLNICKPNTKEADASKPANIFSGFAAPIGGGATPQLSFGFAAKATSTTTTTTTTQPATTFSFAAAIAAASTAATTTTTDTKPQAATATAAVTTSSSSTTPATAPAATTSTTTPTTTTAASAVAVTSSSSSSTFSFSSAFSSLSTSSSTTAAATTTPAKPLFAGAASTTAAPFGTPTNLFAGAATAATTGAASTPPTGNIFGGAAATATSPFTTGTSATSPPAGNFFGTVPKPTSTSGTNLFAGTATATASPFGTTATSATPASSTTSIFGGAATATAPAASGGSIFGGSSSATSINSAFGGFGLGNTANASPFGGAASPFGGGASATSPPATNIFGSPTTATAASGGSIFGQSAFGQSAAAPASGGSIFGGAAQQSSSTTSIFGGSSSSQSGAAAGGSIFGGSSGFGGAFSQPSNAPAFGSPNSSSGSFAQGGASVSQTGFGSPQQQQQGGGAFSKPMFGAAPAFGSPTPAFGAAPSFGGAPTFGSPKPFGTFGSPTAATSPAAASAFGGAAGTQKNNLFETLGSTNDSGLSFGNLAQTGAAQQQPKPVFGGSKFMNYRA